MFFELPSVANQTIKFLNDRKMSREGTSHLCDTQATHESCVPSLQYLIQDLEIDQVILKAVLVSILHSIGPSGMHPFMPGNEKRVTTSRWCTLQKKQVTRAAHPGTQYVTVPATSAPVTAKPVEWSLSRRHTPPVAPSREVSIPHSETLYQVDPPNILFVS